MSELAEMLNAKDRELDLLRARVVTLETAARTLTDEIFEHGTHQTWKQLWQTLRETSK